MYRSSATTNKMKLNHKRSNSRLSLRSNQCVKLKKPIRARSMIKNLNLPKRCRRSALWRFNLPKLRRNSLSSTSKSQRANLTSSHQLSPVALKRLKMETSNACTAPERSQVWSSYAYTSRRSTQSISSRKCGQITNTNESQSRSSDVRSAESHKARTTWLTTLRKLNTATKSGKRATTNSCTKTETNIRPTLIMCLKN